MPQVLLDLPRWDGRADNSRWATDLVPKEGLDVGTLLQAPQLDAPIHARREQLIFASHLGASPTHSEAGHGVAVSFELLHHCVGAKVPQLDHLPGMRSS